MQEAVELLYNVYVGWGGPDQRSLTAIMEAL